MSTDLTRFDFTVRPESPFTLPYSDGYLLYSAILNRVRDADEDASAALHDDDGRIHVSSLDGDFQSSDRRGHHRLQDTEYTFSVGLAADAAEQSDALLEALAFDIGDLQVGDGVLNVHSVESETTSTTTLLETAESYTLPDIHMEFETTACIRAGDHGTTEMFPQRAAVFESLRRSWNNIAPETQQLAVTEADFRTEMYEIPEYDSLRTYNVVVNMINSGDGRKPIKRHGFVGECLYRVHPEASDAFKTATTALALSGEYLGVGSAVSRGCGALNVSVSDR